MKKLTAITLLTLALAPSVLPSPTVLADENVQTVAKSPRRHFNNAEMADLKALIKVASDTLYDPEHMPVFEIVYPAQTARLRNRLNEINATLANYEATNNLSNLKHATTLVYDELADIDSTYNAYRIVFSNHANASKFGSRSACINRAIELDAISHQ